MEKGIIILIIVVFVIIVLVVVGISIWLVIRNRKGEEEEDIDSIEEEEEEQNNPPNNNLCSSYDKELLNSCKTITIGGHNFPSYSFSNKAIRFVANNLYLWTQNVSIAGTRTCGLVDYKDPYYTLEGQRLIVLYGDPDKATTYSDGSVSRSPGLWFSSFDTPEYQQCIFDSRNIIFFSSLDTSTIYLLREGYGGGDQVVAEAVDITTYVNSATSYVEIE